MNEKAIDFQREILEVYEASTEMIQEDEDLKVFAPLLELEIQGIRKTIKCMKENEPLVMNWYACIPEIFRAMDIHRFEFAGPPFHQFLAILNDDLMEQLYYYIDSAPLPNTVCSMHRHILGGLLAGIFPTPTAIVGVEHPCDGVKLLNHALKQYKPWKNVELFTIEAPYHDNDLGRKYFTTEVKAMISFLEKHTGKKLDMDKLREIVDETNIQYELWGECNELGKSVPSPYGGFHGIFCWIIAAISTLGVGNKKGTEFLRNWLEDGKNKLKTDFDKLQEEEKIRVLWSDIPPVWAIEMVNLLRDEFKAKIVADCGGLMLPTSIVDTSTEESMLEGIARRHSHNPLMLNINWGTLDEYLGRIEYMVKSYNIDCVIGPNHNGHKDLIAANGIVTQHCRRIGVPILNFNYDLWDPRVTSLDEMKVFFADFFENMGLGG